MFYFIIFIFGLAIGSFLNVVICRLETKESILISRSYCPKCKKFLKWYDLIPVLSFIFSLGRCRYCDKKISWQYPVVEISTACIFLLIFSFGFTQDKNFINLIYYLIISSLLLVVFVYDLKHYIIPDKIVFPGIVIALIYLIYSSAKGGPASGWQFSILSALVASGFFLSLVLISKYKWMGLGDVKLAFLMGLVLGWPNIFVALFLSFAFGAIIGLILIAFKKKGLKSEIPFGPFLSASTLLMLFLGDWLADKLLIIF